MRAVHQRSSCLATPRDEAEQHDARGPAHQRLAVESGPLQASAAGKLAQRHHASAASRARSSQDSDEHIVAHSRDSPSTLHSMYIIEHSTDWPHHDGRGRVRNQYQRRQRPQKYWHGTYHREHTLLSILPGNHQSRGVFDCCQATGPGRGCHVRTHRSELEASSCASIIIRCN